VSECVVVPKSDWQEILDAVRYGTEDSELLRSGEVASEIEEFSATIDGILDGSIEHFKNSRLTSIRQFAFMRAQDIKTVVLPNITSIPTQSFAQCKSLEKADFSSIIEISANAFTSSAALTTLIIRTNTVCNLSVSTAIAGTPIYNCQGYIYVPAALVDEYKQATNWTLFADYIRAIEDYPEITGGAI
jgi:hypothetical protein